MEHPHGVQPALGLFEEGGGQCRGAREARLGTLASLPDEAILHILELLPARDLARLATASTFLWAFCQHDELWKALCLEELEAGWDFQGTWQDSYLAARGPGYRPGTRQQRKVAGLQSDLLYTPWLCATAAIDPAWLEVDTVERRSGLSLEEFRERYEAGNRPVILTDVVTRWPAKEKWSRGYLQRAFEGKQVIVGDQPISFGAYCKYADGNRDELPLYLFDKTFCQTAPQLAQDYSAPEVMSDDLFSLLGESRPDWRWLIIGPYRSGSTWHKDPNSTSAWNGVVRGSKKWVMYPPHITPPGVRPSGDGADVACPVSLMEWFLSFYDHKDSVGCSPAECVLKEGELLFVPRNWWHVALNLDPDTVAVTQNFVSPANLPHVLAHLRSRSAALVSGCAADERAGLHDRFVAALREHRPELLAAVEAREAAAAQRAEEQHKLAGLFKVPGEQASAAAEETGNKGAADGSSSAAAAPPGAGGFTFGFKL